MAANFLFSQFHNLREVIVKLLPFSLWLLHILCETGIGFNTGPTDKDIREHTD